MRNSSNLKIITSHVEYLEDFKSQLEIVQTNVLTVIEKAELWIEEKENDFSFLEMNQFLTNETSKLILKCHNIASDNNESDRAIALETPLSGPNKSYLDEKEHEMLKERLENMEKTLSTHSRKFKTVNQKLKTLENYNETNYNNNDWIMQELNSASEFITQIQSENKMLTERITSDEQSMSKLIAISESWQIEKKRLEEQIEEVQKIIRTNEKSNSMKMEEVGKNVHDTNITINSSNETFDVLQDCVTALGIKVGDVSSEMQTLRKMVQEIDYPSMHVIFSANVDLKTTEWTFKKNSIVNCFKAVSFNSGGYNPKTGIHTVSSSGIHKCRVAICTSTDQHIQLGLFKTNFRYSYKKMKLFGSDTYRLAFPQRYKKMSEYTGTSKSYSSDESDEVGDEVDDDDNDGEEYEGGDGQCKNEELVATSLYQVENTERTVLILSYVQLDQGDMLYVKSLTEFHRVPLQSNSQFKCSFLNEI